MDGRSLQELIEGEGVTFALGVPTVFTMLIDHLDESGKQVDSLERVAIGGSAVPRAMIERLADPYGVTVPQLWGMTETSPLGTMATATPAIDALAQEEREAVLSQQGRVQFGLELTIVDADGARSRATARPSATCGCGATGPPAATSRARAATGSTRTAGSRRAMSPPSTSTASCASPTAPRTWIKSGGEWISSIDLENAAGGPPDVKQAAVIGVFHPKWEERPLMVVVPRDGCAPDKDTLNAYLAARVAKWWLPDDVVLVDELPLTATGKSRNRACARCFGITGCRTPERVFPPHLRLLV